MQPWPNDAFTDFVEAAFISGILIIASCMAFYELMYIIWKRIDNYRANHRRNIFYILIGIFTAHTVTVLVYGVIYYFLMREGAGNLYHTSSGKIVPMFTEYLYFSVVTYSSLGMDDVLPSGHLKFLSGAEVLNGMVLIAWSASFTYISMEKFWNIRKTK